MWNYCKVVFGQLALDALIVMSAFFSMSNYRGMRCKSCLICTRYKRNRWPVSKPRTDTSLQFVVSSALSQGPWHTFCKDAMEIGARDSSTLKLSQSAFTDCQRCDVSFQFSSTLELCLLLLRVEYWVSRFSTLVGNQILLAAVLVTIVYKRFHWVRSSEYTFAAVF